MFIKILNILDKFCLHYKILKDTYNLYGRLLSAVFSFFMFSFIYFHFCLIIYIYLYILSNLISYVNIFDILMPLDHYFHVYNIEMDIETNWLIFLCSYWLVTIISLS